MNLIRGGSASSRRFAGLKARSAPTIPIKAVATGPTLDRPDEARPNSEKERNLVSRHGLDPWTLTSRI